MGTREKAFFVIYMHNYNGYRFTLIPLPLEDYRLHKQETKLKRKQTEEKKYANFLEQQQCRSTRREGARCWNSARTTTNAMPLKAKWPRGPGADIHQLAFCAGGGGGSPRIG